MGTPKIQLLQISANSLPQIDFLKALHSCKDKNKVTKIQIFQVEKRELTRLLSMPKK